VPIFESQGQQTPCIDPIQEVYSFEKDESMINENNYFINNDNFAEKSFDNIDRLNMSCPLINLEQKQSSLNIQSSSINNPKFDSTYDDSCSIFRFRTMYKIQTICSNLGTNKSEFNINEGLRFKSCKKEEKEDNSSFPNIINNLSCNLTINQKKRGRKKFFPDGIKREVIDKAFLRHFKLYLRDSKVFKNYKFDPEEKTFWTEFSQNNNPPIRFTIGNQKVEYKSFSTNLMKFIFSHNSVRNLYDQFSKEKHLIQNLLDKKIKNINDNKIKQYYFLYGSNMHKFYSQGMENSVYSSDIIEPMFNNNSVSNNNPSFPQNNDFDMSN